MYDPQNKFYKVNFEQRDEAFQTYLTERNVTPHNQLAVQASDRVNFRSMGLYSIHQTLFNK